MDDQLPWFRELPAEKRSMVTLVAQAGVRQLVQWMRNEGADTGISDEVFEAAPVELARAISLQHTVALIQVTCEVVEEQVPALAAEGEDEALREAVLRFSREIAFAAARVYARAAESRGAWDARLQAMLVDALLRGDGPDELAGRAAALGWSEIQPVTVACGNTPGGETTAVLHSVQKAARRLGVEVLAGVHGARLVVLIGGIDDALPTVEKLTSQFGEGPIVVGHSVAGVTEASSSAHAAVTGHRAAAAWPDAPCPALATQLLPERAVAGDIEARKALRTGVYVTLKRAGGELLETMDAFISSGGVLEGTARALYVHPNTVRYRLRRIHEVTGLAPTEAHDAFALRVGLAIGRLESTPAQRHKPSLQRLL
nr:PucR family transcriptional regulator [Natronoglycomyces albus]